MALDPVCKMEVDPTSTEWVSEYRGIRYFFCEPGCKAMFDQAPERWTSGNAQMHSTGGCSCCGGH